jgi:hypothetical protein
MREPCEFTNDADRGKTSRGATEGHGEGIGRWKFFWWTRGLFFEDRLPANRRTTLGRSYSPRVLPTSRLNGNPNLGRSFKVNVRITAIWFLPAPLLAVFRPNAATQLLRSR